MPKHISLGVGGGLILPPRRPCLAGLRYDVERRYVMRKFRHASQCHQRKLNVSRRARRSVALARCCNAEHVSNEAHGHTLRGKFLGGVFECVKGLLRVSTRAARTHGLAIWLSLPPMGSRVQIKCRNRSYSPPLCSDELHVQDVCGVIVDLDVREGHRMSNVLVRSDERIARWSPLRFRNSCRIAEQ
ncbi:hypothetical protein BIW11_04694 [Tropilaelaps mercedesae]|uniref:Uncharacterized protein n=1 Tax=Tropilaelaps mercedesae TaxID=418985 RepID=A0A1V9X322_9ACAR|nr:hypothetical protein BIW11_04694 [Tropilaelaps mercedesae]